MTRTPPPMLHLREAGPDRVRLAATLLRAKGDTPPKLEADGTAIRPDLLACESGTCLWRYDFSLPVSDSASYRIDGVEHGVDTDYRGDLHIAFASCNGQEHGDLDRPEAVRNALWHHLTERHGARPLHLLLHGGDQIYADEATAAHPLTEGWPEDLPDRLTDAQRSEIRVALSRAFFDRYATQIAQPGFADLVCRVPSLSMWDDHDICDGWGSLSPDLLDSDTGRLIFRCARDAFLLFQFGCRPDEVPEICLDPEGRNLAWQMTFPGLTILAPDLRSTRRPDRVMDDAAWADFTAALDRAGPGRVLLMSSVPALGPRLSLVERAIQITRQMRHYEDDLRDQWQSRAHRAEWRRFLQALIAKHETPDTVVAVLSGEIHLATRGTMDTAAGPLHQFVASGIAHPAPTGLYAQALGTLARLGEAPLRSHPIRLRPLPGARGIYAAERNYLLLQRKDAAWSARWHLEESGTTPALAF